MKLSKSFLEEYKRLNTFGSMIKLESFIKKCFKVVYFKENIIAFSLFYLDDWNGFNGKGTDEKIKREKTLYYLGKL